MICWIDCGAKGKNLTWQSVASKSFSPRKISLNAYECIRHFVRVSLVKVGIHLIMSLMNGSCKGFVSSMFWKW